jgi:hypothetical protein
VTIATVMVTLIQVQRLVVHDVSINSEASLLLDAVDCI